MRVFYNILVTLGLPFVAIYWAIRALSDAEYRANLGQRFGFGYPPRPSGRLVWVHAVSVGEVQASAPLVRAIQERMPGAHLLLTTVTPTGGDRVRLLFGDTVEHAYAPYDLGAAVRRFYRHVRPDLAIIVETELWPNLYHQAGVRDVPLVLASARISPRSMPRYRRLVGLFREALSNGIIIAAQSEVDRQRFIELGALPERTFVSGNIKFDVEFNVGVAQQGRELRDQWFPRRPVWVAGSTHEGEEAIILDAHARVLEQVPDALLILVPRHPPRFEEVAELLTKQGVRFERRSRTNHSLDHAEVLLGDTMGELNMFYAAADVAFVAGSLVPIGGHNLLEPARLGKPVITGPHLFNAQDIATMFTDSGAAQIVEDAQSLAQKILDLISDEDACLRMADNAAGLISANQGAVNRLLDRLEPIL
ncbi:MAG: lipid IV(A) 3-deoxy-D-manno-octulosonic acid transferase [Pseudomonadota bacterium]